MYVPGSNNKTPARKFGSSRASFAASRPKSAGSRVEPGSIRRGTWGGGSRTPEYDTQEPIMRKRSDKKGSSIFSRDVDAHEVMDDLLGLGIKLDKAQVSRMQNSLNTRTRLETARKLANERRSALEGKLSYSQNKVKTDKDLALSRSYASTYSAHKGFMPLNSKRVAELVKDIDNRTGKLKADSRAIMNRVIDALQVEYKRNADVFVLKLLDVPAGASKRGMTKSKEFTKTLLKDDGNRFLDLTAFSNGILNVLPDIPNNEVIMLFSLLSERMRQMDEDGRVWTMVVCVDVVGFLCLLDHASLDKRRSFAHKTSKAANDVEFWSDKRYSFSNKGTLNPAEAKAIPQPSNRGMSVRPRQQFGAVGGNSDLSSFNDMLRTSTEIEAARIAQRDSVPSLLNNDVRKASDKSYGALNKEYSTSAQYGVEEALKSPRKNALATPRKATYMYSEQFQKKDKHLHDKAEIARMALDGVGMAQAMGATEAATKVAGIQKPGSSFATLQREEYNMDSIASALGAAREDFIGRSVRWEQTAQERANRTTARESDFQLALPKDLPLAGGSEPATPGANQPPPPPPAAQAAQPQNTQTQTQTQAQGRNVVKDSSPIRHKSFGIYDKDVKSNREQYSASTALASDRFSNKAPEKNSRFFMEVEQFQHKPKQLLSNYNDIVRQSKQGVGVFQCMNYQSGQ